MDWVDVGSRFGIPFLMLVGFGWFGVRFVWPFLVKQVEDSKQAVSASLESFSKEREGFLEALRDRDHEFLEAMSRRDANQARTAQTLESMLSVLESIERRTH